MRVWDENKGGDDRTNNDEAGSVKGKVGDLRRVRGPNDFLLIHWSRIVHDPKIPRREQRFKTGFDWIARVVRSVSFRLFSYSDEYERKKAAIPLALVFARGTHPGDPAHCPLGFRSRA